MFSVCSGEQFAWCEPCCQSDDTIQNCSDIFDTIVITEVWKRLGERESKRCQAQMEEGCHAREMTSLPLPRGIWICWWTQFQSDSILVDTSLEIHPSIIF